MRFRRRQRFTRYSDQRRARPVEHEADFEGEISEGRVVCLGDRARCISGTWLANSQIETARRRSSIEIGPAPVLRSCLS